MPETVSIEKLESLSLIDLAIRHLQEPTNEVVKLVLTQKVREFTDEHYITETEFSLSLKQLVNGSGLDNLLPATIKLIESQNHKDSRVGLTADLNTDILSDLFYSYESWEINSLTQVMSALVYAVNVTLKKAEADYIVDLVPPEKALSEEEIIEREKVGKEKDIISRGEDFNSLEVNKIIFDLTRYINSDRGQQNTWVEKLINILTSDTFPTPTTKLIAYRAELNIKRKSLLDIINGTHTKLEKANARNLLRSLDNDTSLTIDSKLFLYDEELKAQESVAKAAQNKGIGHEVCLPLLNSPSLSSAKKIELYTFISSNIKESDAESLLEKLNKTHEYEQLSLYENEVELISHNIVQAFIYKESPTENIGVSHIIKRFENVAISATERVKNFELYRLESLILICDQRIKELEAPTTIFSGKQEAIGILRNTRAILNNASSENAKSKIAEFQAKIEENKTILTKNGVFNSLWALIAPIFSLTLKPQKKSDVFINAVAQLGENEGSIELRSRSNSDANSPTEAKKDIPSATRRNFIERQETTSSLQARSSSYLQQCSTEVISSLPPMPGHTPGVYCS